MHELLRGRLTLPAKATYSAVFTRIEKPSMIA
jgi:hypothetical protein